MPTLSQTTPYHEIMASISKKPLGRDVATMDGSFKGNDLDLLPNLASEAGGWRRSSRSLPPEDATQPLQMSSAPLLLSSGPPAASLKLQHAPDDPTRNPETVEEASAPSVQEHHGLGTTMMLLTQSRSRLQEEAQQQMSRPISSASLRDASYDASLLYVTPAQGNASPPRS
jgi:hypothetical protein